MRALEFICGIVVGLSVWAAYGVGVNDGRNDVVWNCSSYGRYVLVDSSYQVNCVGPYDPLALGPPEYRPYTQEQKDKHKKDRR